MKPEAARIADTRAWLVKAKNDLRAAEHEFSAVPPLFGDIVFHCQQAVEKALKGFLTWHDQPFRKTHDLAELGGQCAVVDPGLEECCRRADKLTVYAWVFRYPGEEEEEPSREEAEEALSLAREVYSAILGRLPIGTRT